MKTTRTYALGFLKARSEGELSAGAVEVEYRLACSGALYNRNIKTGDWRKSDATRVLLRTPFELFVASHPFDNYPQELCARLVVNRAIESDGSFTRGFLPDEYVIEDLCSLLTLLSRRLITPVGKIRERHPTGIDGLGSYGEDVPIPVMGHSKVASWKKRPATIITTVQEQNFTPNDPPPVGVDDDALSTLFRTFSTIEHSENIVNAARLYRTALELIESRPDIAYQLLVSTVETLVGAAREVYQPDETEKIKTKQEVQTQAKKYGLTEVQANHLASLACKGIPWAEKKFIRFLVNHVPLTSLLKTDPLFFLPEALCPPPRDFEKTLKAIYGARSGSLHRGSAFPRSIALGTSPWHEARNLPLNLLKPDKVPPVTWFERVVSLAAQKFLLDQNGARYLPFVEEAD
jgi:hypothetical protein